MLSIERSPFPRFDELQGINVGAQAYIGCEKPADAFDAVVAFVVFSAGSAVGGTHPYASSLGLGDFFCQRRNTLPCPGARKDLIVVGSHSVPNDEKCDI